MTLSWYWIVLIAIVAIILILSIIEYIYVNKTPATVIKIPKTYKLIGGIIIYNKEWKKYATEHDADIEDMINNYEKKGYRKIIPNEMLVSRVCSPLKELFVKLKSVGEVGNPVSTIVDSFIPSINKISAPISAISSNTKCRVLVPKDRYVKCTLNGKKILFLSK